MAISNSILAALNNNVQSKRFTDSLVSVIKKCTIPILVNQGESYRQNGTGTLLRVAERSFLVTAGHVYKDAQSHGLTLYIGASESRVQPLLGKFYHTPGGDDDPYDLGVRELPDNIAENLRSFEFARFIDVITPSRTEQDIYCLAGFPTALSMEANPDRQTAESKVILILAGLYRSSTTGFRNVNPEFHVLLDTNRSNAGPIDAAGAQSMPVLEGISGCGIWKTNLASVQRIEDWEPSQAKLIAIQTCTYQDNQVIRGTFWSGVVTLIEREFPELAPALRLLLRRER